MTLVPKTYDRLCDSVGAGVAYGYRRARKYDDDPSEHVLIDAIYNAVVTQICEDFHIVEGDATHEVCRCTCGKTDY